MRATRFVIVFITGVTMTAACGSRPMPAGPTTSLGHFGVSRDQVRVNNGDVTILSGGFFS